MGPDAQYCADQVRRADHDRFLATLYAPAPARPALFALHALDLELQSVVDSTTEPMLGEIRLAWWRESLQKLDEGVTPAQPVLATLAAEALPQGVTGGALKPLEDAYLAVLSGAAFESVEMALSYADTRGGTLFVQALTLLQPDAPSAAAEAIRHAGQVWALVSLLGHGAKDEVRANLATAAEQALAAARASAGAIPPAARSLLALARLARRDLEAGRRAGIVGRQTQLLWSVISGNL